MPKVQWCETARTAPNPFDFERQLKESEEAVQRIQNWFKQIWPQCSVRRATLAEDKPGTDLVVNYGATEFAVQVKDDRYAASVPESRRNIFIETMSDERTGAIGCVRKCDAGVFITVVGDYFWWCWTANLQKALDEHWSTKHHPRIPVPNRRGNSAWITTGIPIPEMEFARLSKATKYTFDLTCNQPVEDYAK